MSLNLIASSANLVSLARCLAAPVVYALISAREWRAALLLFCLAGASDALDGYLARRFDQCSRLGEWLDPIADKTLIFFVYLGLAAAGALPVWIAVAVLFRDVAIAAGAALSLAAARPASIDPHVLSKAAMAAQVALAAWALAGRSYGFGAGVAGESLTGATLALTYASGGVYLFSWLKHMRPENVG